MFTKFKQKNSLRNPEALYTTQIYGVTISAQ